MTEKCCKTNDRTNLFSKLDDVIAISHKKVTAERGNADQIKQGWARIMITAVSAYGDLLKDVDLEQLKGDIEEIKKELKLDVH